jgi:hypothetical protein
MLRNDPDDMTSNPYLAIPSQCCVFPKEPEEYLLERAYPEHLSPVNPEWQEQEPLTPQQKALLSQFKKKLRMVS